MAYVSVLMPVYNASPYIAEAIGSVVNQTYTDWELIIVDDQSTDGSYQIACALAEKEPRIKCYQLEANSGSAQKPRSYAEEKATGRFLSMLDSDDVLDSHFLEELIDRQRETDADFICGAIYSMTEDGTSSRLSIPTTDFDYTQIITGKEAYMLTIGGWKISGQGLLRRSVAEEARKRLNISFDNINADEVLTRLRFLSSNKVAFCPSIYYYRDNSASITKHFSTKCFGYMEATAALLAISESYFGKHSVEYNKTQQQFFFAIIRSMHDYIEHKNEIGEKEKYAIWNRILTHWHEVDKFSLRQLSWRMFFTYLMGPRCFYYRLKFAR